MDPKTDSKPAARPASTLPVISGLSLSKQRQEVYQVLLEQRDHPTANEVHQRVRKKLPSISLATVYNCLEALVNHGLVNQVNFERSSSRFCPNLVDHGHFQDTRTGCIYDITIKEGVDLKEFINLPDDVCIEEAQITLRGSIITPQG